MKHTLCILWILIIAVSVAGAQTPTVMNYQGRLTDNTPGQDPVDATLPMEFAIYDAAVGGSMLWSEPWAAVDVVDGIFSVLLGTSIEPLPSSVFTTGFNLYLEVIVNGETLSPRQQIGSVGFAHQAATSGGLDCAGCVTGADILNSTITGSDIAANTITSADIATNGVAASEIAANAVGASEIAADAVGASEIAANAVGNSELNNNSAFNFNGPLTINNAGGQKFVTQNGGATKLEWWAEASYSYLYHRPAGTYLAVNDSTGNWGIGTTSPSARFHVNGAARVDSNLDVQGTTFLGWERITASNTTGTTASNCFQGGTTWTCYTGSVDAVCSAGKILLGGGCAGSGITDSVAYGYPVNSTSYRCNNAEDNSGQTFTAYAICARVGN
jgi:hypothetical protein